MGLRESLDEGAGEIGDDIGEEIPSSATEVRDRVPAGVEELPLGRSAEDIATGREQTSGQPSVDLSIDAVLDDTPLDRFL